MEISHPSIQIYSDIGYWSYQHVNQMLHRCLARRQVNVEFLHRLVMNPPSKQRILGLLGRRTNGRAMSPQPVRDVRPAAPASVHGKVKRIYNLPSVSAPLDYINQELVLRQLGSVAEMAITFVPSLALKRVFDRYKTLIYYCVHDATKQSYRRRNVEYEMELVKRARIVLCDNASVLSRLAQGQPVLDLSCQAAVEQGQKFILVPPPIPNSFFELDFVQPEKTYDAIYFGSVHENIDQAELRRLTAAGLRVAVVSSQRLEFDSECLTYYPLQSDFTSLARLIASSRSILLPYKNSEFMETVSPAKINQVVSTGLPVFCGNRKLTLQHGLLPTGAIRTGSDLKRFVASYKLDAGRREQLRAYRESALLGRVADLILKMHGTRFSNTKESRRDICQQG